MTPKPSDIAPEIPELQEERHAFPGPDDTDQANDRENDSIESEEDDAATEDESESDKRA